MHNADNNIVSVACSHCWHSVGVETSTTMAGPNHGGSSVVCCQCAARGVRPWHEELQPLPGHGPMFRQVRRVYGAVMVDQGSLIGAEVDGG